ncbi:MAG: crotonase/enoyl-CoA hydratase family protein [Pseudomonadota bacterium]
MSNPVQLQFDQKLALALIDDGKANVFSHAMIDRLHAVLDEVEGNEAARALVLTGRDNRFSAGFDLSVMSAGNEAVRGLVGAGARLALRLYEYPKPLVMACTGHALAMGAIALFTADWRTGANGAFKIGMNETAIGMTMPEFGAELARDRLAATHYTRAVVGAEILSPPEAVLAGYLDEVVDPLSVVDFACVQAERLAALHPRAFAATKRRTRAATVARIRAGLEADLAGLGGPG